MADSSAATGLTVQQWDDKFFLEYLQDNPFRGDMGSSELNIIQVKDDLTKKKGDKINFALVNKLTNAAITGSSTLEGNEEDMASRSHQLTVDKRRNGVRTSEMEEQKSAISLRNAARAVLKDWAMEDTRDQIIAALASINGVAYGSASEAQKDAWLVDNADRVLFGAAIANNTGPGDHSAGLVALDNTNDKLTSPALSLMKRIALSANPKVRPISVKGQNRRFYKVYCPSRCFRDLLTDSAIQQAQREVSLAEENNRLFKGGDIVWNGMVITEVDDIAVTTNGTIDVAPVYLCGAQAVGVGYAKHWKSETETFDYGDKNGVAIDGIYGVEKMTFGSGSGDTDDLKDHGVVTGWFAAVADS